MPSNLVNQNMEIRAILFSLLVAFGSTIAVSQPKGVITVNANDISFASDSAFRVTPSRLNVTLSIDNSAEVEAEAFSDHLELQQSIF
jgi:hypothetical protein